MERVFEDFKGSVSYKRYLFLLRIAEYGSNVIGMDKVDIIKKVSKIREELELNELELALFYYYMERFGWNDQRNKEEVLWFVAYAAKCFLNEYSPDLFSRLQNKFGFFSFYKEWIARYTAIINVGYPELNGIYNKLCRADIAIEEVDPYDYNNEVSNLIENSTRVDKG